jgi:hypothetical protein
MDDSLKDASSHSFAQVETERYTRSATAAVS